MAKILLRTTDRAEAHTKQAAVIADLSAPASTCTEDAYEVIVWDSQPDAGEVQRAIAERDDAIAGKPLPPVTP